MQLKDYPRPENDSGRGFHWAPSTSVWGKDQWYSKWKPFLEEAQIKWIKVLDDGGGSNLELIKRLIGMGIMPIVRMYRHPNYPDPIGGREVEYSHLLAELGVYYIEYGNEPDLALEWKDEQRPDNWEEIVARNFISAWDRVHQFGTIPLYDAYGPGGRGNPYKMIKDWGREDVFQQMAIAVHNYCLSRPLDYPDDSITQKGRPWTKKEYDDFCQDNWGPALQGEPWQWVWEMPLEEVNAEIARSANPGVTIMEDNTCFRAFEYLANLFYEQAGFHVPIITTEGGYNVGQRAPYDGRYPKVTNKTYTEAMLEMFNMYPYPNYYFTPCPWFFAGYQMGVYSSAYEPQGPAFTNWYDTLFNLTGELGIVQALKDTEPRLIQDGPAPEQWQKYKPPLWYEDRQVSDETLLVDPQILIEPYLGDASQYWFVSQLGFMDNGNGYVYFRCLDESGNFIEGIDVQMYDQSGNIHTAPTKGPMDQGWGNLPYYGAPLGTFTLQVKEQPGDNVINLGNGRVVGEGANSVYVTFIPKEKKT